jgi:hypothetical protein
VPRYTFAVSATHRDQSGFVRENLTTLRDLLDNPNRDDWDELLAANRALIKAIAKNKPMTRNNARIVAEYLREAGWGERAICAAGKSGADLESSGGTVAKS